MKTRLILLICISVLITACAPQVTVTPQATVTLTPPPTATVLPTPTLHPQFIVLQDQIAAAGERFTLNPDGTVQDGATTIPGLQVGNDGKITITVNGEQVEIDPSIMNFDDENGLSVEGFEDADGDGDWEKLPVFTPEQLADMTPEQKLKAAPDEPGFTKTINGVYVIYTDEDGAKKDTAYNLTTGEWVSVNEIVNYPTCTLEQFEGCKFTLEDFTSGKVDAWLKTLSRPFDLEKMNPIPLEIYLGNIGPLHSSAPNFEVPGSETFHRDTTFGYLEYEEAGVKYQYIFMPVEFYDQKTGKSNWVKTLVPVYDDPVYKLGYEYRVKFAIDAWEAMNVTPIQTNDIGNPIVKLPDPLVSKVFARYPDMVERFNKFVSGEDMSVLSNPDMFLLAQMFKINKPWYK